MMLAVTSVVVLFIVTSFSQVRVQPNPSSSVKQPEPYIAVNPTDPNNMIIVAVTIFNTAPDIRIGGYFTRDNGQTWNGSDDISQSANDAGDPVVAFDGAGNAYCIYMVKDEKTVCLRKSTDGGENWGDASPALVVLQGESVDKPWLAAGVDPNSSGSYDVFVTATVILSGGTTKEIRYRKSSNGGTTFANSWTFPSSTSDFQGSYVAIGLDNEIFVGWSEISRTPPYQATNIQIHRSLDGGSTFSSHYSFLVKQFGVPRHGGNDWEIAPDIRVDCYPRIVVDRSGQSTRGSVYVVWAGHELDTWNSDIWFRVRTGTSSNPTWSSIDNLFVNRPNSQWSPAVSIGPDGVLGLLYYERDTTNGMVKVWLERRSIAGSANLSETVGVQPFFQITSSGAFLGDYIGLENRFGKSCAVWTEYRNGQEQLYFKTLTHQATVPPGYSGVTVNQFDESAAPFGKFGRWRTSAFVDYATGSYFHWPQGSSEVLRASQAFKPSSTQKYTAWLRGSTTEPDVQNHHVFNIDVGFPTSLSSTFKTANNATLQAQLLDGGSPGGTVNFLDPWKIDTTDSFGARNQGMLDWHRPISYSQYNIGISSSDSGVFLLENPTFDPLKTSYSVNAPSLQALNGFTSYFQNWISTGGSASFQNSSSVQTKLVFNSTGATVSARYKANLGSSLSSATGATSQRKLIQDYIHGYYHLVYESAGDVWYTKSTNGGTTWTAEVLLSSGNGTSHNPCFSEVRDNHYSAYAFWVAPTQRSGATGYDMYAKKLDLSSGAWSATEVTLLPDAGSSTGLARSDAKPSAVLIGESGYAPIVAVFYEGASTGLKYAYKVWSESWESYVWLNNDLNNTTTSSARPATTIYNGYPQIVHVTYDNGANIYLNSSNTIEYYSNSVYFPSSPTLISVSVQFYNNANSVIAMDSYSNKLIAWTAYDPDIERHVVLERSQMSGNWTSTNSFFSDLGEEPMTLTASVCGHEGYAGGTLYFSDGMVVFNQRTTDGSYWPNMGYIYYGTPITAPNLLSTTMPQYMASFFTKNGAAPYQLKFDLRNNGGGLGKSQMDTLKQISFDTKVLRRILVSDPLGTDGVLLQLGNFKIKNSRTERVLQFASLGGKPVSGANSVFTSSELFPVDEASILTLETQVKPLAWTKGGSVSIDLVDENGAVKTNLYSTQLSVGSTETKLQTIQRTVSLSDKSQKVRVALKVTGIDQQKYQVDFVNQMIFSKPAAGDNGEAARSSVAGIPESDGLLQSYPNPFNPATQVPFGLKEGGNVSMVVCDILGREVAVLANGYFGAGYHSTTWNASSVASGVYFVRFVLSDTEGKLVSSKVSKLLLMK